MLNIGATNLALSLAASTTEIALPFPSSVSTPDEINNLKTSQQAVQNRVTGIRNEGFKILQYPLDLRKFYMRIDFKKYERPNPSNLATINPNHAICLPIPNNLTDAFDLDYGSYDGGIAQQFIGSLFNPEQGLTPSPLYANLNKMTGAAKAFVNIAQQNMQIALNPLKSVIFNSPNFKQYQFTWTFAPNTEQESEALRQVIKNLKSSILPTYAPSVDNKNDFNIFNYPYMAQIHLFPWAGDTSKPITNNDAEMFQTKHGFIDKLSINYSPENNLSFFDSAKNSPTFVELSFSFIEIELHTAEDYGRNAQPGDKTTADVVKGLGANPEDLAKVVIDLGANTGQ